MQDFAVSLIQEFRWLLKNRKVRMRYCEYPETFNRINHSTVTSVCTRSDKEALLADIRVLKDRMNHYQRILKRRKYNDTSKYRKPWKIY